MVFELYMESEVSPLIGYSVKMKIVFTRKDSARAGGYTHNTELRVT